MQRDVALGLSMPQKELPSKYFYDHRGSELFEAITELPEYYPTRTERAMLAAEMPALMRELRPASLVELGAGSAAKTRIILDAMREAGRARHYVPIDVSASFLGVAADRLRAEYPGLSVEPAIADFTERLPMGHELPHPAVIAFLGSTIGNFTPLEAVRVLRRVRAAMSPGDRFLLGADLQKDVGRLLAAYDDAAGVTALFNLNILRVINRELGADFNESRFTHRAAYDGETHRIEMHLVSSGAQIVHVPGTGDFQFGDGETVRTEISCKYTRPVIEHALCAAGMRLDRWFTDSAGDFALTVAARGDDA
jgi:L-histidine N-alpha-methyltransferase